MKLIYKLNKWLKKQEYKAIQISEGGRAQMAQAQGKAFEFQAQEGRDQAKLDRLWRQDLHRLVQIVANANAAAAASTSAAISGVGNIASSLVGSMGND